MDLPIACPEFALKCMTLRARLFNNWLGARADDGDLGGGGGVASSSTGDSATSGLPPAKKVS